MQRDGDVISALNVPPFLRRSPGFLIPGALALVTLFGVLALDRYAAHGLTATYFVGEAGRRQVLFEDVEHRVAQKSETRALGNYAQHWDFRRFKLSPSAPPFDIVLQGTLHVPGKESMRLVAQGTGTITLLVDGRAVEEVRPGRHALSLHWRDEVLKNKRAELGLFWQDAKGQLEPLAPWTLTPHGGSLTLLRITTWSIGAPLILLLLVLTVVLYRNRAGFDVPIVHILVTLAILALSLGMRGFDYDVVPDFRENGDEMFAAWNGFSLLDEGKSRGWSLWYARYGSKVKVEPVSWLGSSEFKVITPYFEHPPLMHVLAGVAAKLGGAKHWLETQQRYTRVVPVLLSVLCTWLVISIGRSLSPKSASPYLGGLLYATIPTIVIQGRVVKEEALLTFLMLLGCQFFLRYRHHGLLRDLIFAATALGLCALTKITGVVFVAVLVMWLTAERAYREAFIAGAIGLGVSSLVLIYGALLDWDNFWFATVYQATNRPRHFNLLLRFFDDALINHSLIGRGWLLFLWLAFVSWVGRQATSTRRIVLIPLVVYLFAIAVPSGNWTFGWYAQPLYPWLCLGAGAFVAEAFERPSLWHGALIIGVLVMYAINFTMTPGWAKDPAHWAELRRAVTAYVALSMTPYALYEAFPKARATLWLGRITTALALIGFVGLSGYFVTHYDTIRYTHEDFDRMKHFDR